MSHISLTYHIIWRTKNSRHTITPEFERDIYAYILGFCKNKKCHLYRVNSMPDHFHMCVEVSPTIALSEFVKVLKQETSRFISSLHHKFPNFDGWANGYAAFSYSARERANVMRYIAEQKEHHQTTTFADEYRKFMSEFGLDPNKDRFLQD